MKKEIKQEKKKKEQKYNNTSIKLSIHLPI